MTTQMTKLSWTRNDDGTYTSGNFVIVRVNTKYFQLIERQGQDDQQIVHVKGRLKECQEFAQDLENKEEEFLAVLASNPNIEMTPIATVAVMPSAERVTQPQHCTCSDPDFYAEPCDLCMASYHEDMRFGRDIPVHDFVAEPRASTTHSNRTMKGMTRAYRKALRKDRIYMPLRGTFHVIDTRGRVLAPEDVSLETFNLIVAGAAKMFGQAI